MPDTYRDNRSWSDQFLPEIRRAIGGHLLSVAADPFDWHEATDLMMLEAKDLRIAARVRRPGYRDRYPHQFTLRSRLPSGAETELAKVVNGSGDWLFYGHASASGRGLDGWSLIDLRAFRAGLIRQAANGYRIRSGDQQNPDGTWFKWFDMRSFPTFPPLVVAVGGATRGEQSADDDL
ncbi:hypothetical protein [Wenxinia saemankumensis]|uniref:Uncharacterized protein n=1 Tax=Wenxinia saemankumensis TaxID=1447782 RepID=A0A1M6HQZ0_9RHOB|nr:hypothetical protein [Wenxinia saemankumensis]SHJ24597.1 hypothetical protein SAMN05444417_3303 [Wenxinia saemankumensis]